LLTQTPVLIVIRRFYPANDNATGTSADTHTAFATKRAAEKEFTASEFL